MTNLPYLCLLYFQYRIRKLTETADTTVVVDDAKHHAQEKRAFPFDVIFLCTSKVQC